MKVNVTMHIRELRKAKGLTIEKLSKLSSVSVSYISEIEAGQYNPTINILCLLATALDVSPADLFTYDVKK